jgi:hypothetical protein
LSDSGTLPPFSASLGIPDMTLSGPKTIRLRLRGITGELIGTNPPRLAPKFERNRHRINVESSPPFPFIALAVKLAMVDTAQRHRELIRYPAAERSRLRQSKMMRLARLPSTHGAWLTGYETTMISVANAFS